MAETNTLRVGASDAAGYFYELNLWQFVALRSLFDENITDIQLSKKVDEVGTWGDVIVSFKYKHGEDQTYFIQVKHTTSQDKHKQLNQEYFLGHKKTLIRLDKQFEDLNKVKKYCERTEGLDFHNCKWIIFTNAIRSENINTVKQRCETDVNIFNTTSNEEDIFTFPTNSSTFRDFLINYPESEEDLKLFFERLIFFSQQKGVDDIREMIIDIFKERFPLVNSGKCTDGLNEFFVDSVKKKKDVNRGNIQDELRRLFFEELKYVYSETVPNFEVQFTDSSFKELETILLMEENICGDQLLLLKFRIKCLVERCNNYLFLSMNDVLQYEDNIQLWMSSTSQKNCLIVDRTGPGRGHVEQTLDHLKMLNSGSHIVFLLPKSTEYTTIDTNLSHLTEKSQQQILNMPVNFQGHFILIRDLGNLSCSHEWKSLVSGQTLLDLISGAEFRLGDLLESCEQPFILRNVSLEETFLNNWTELLIQKTKHNYFLTVGNTPEDVVKKFKLVDVDQESITINGQSFVIFHYEHCHFLQTLTSNNLMEEIFEMLLNRNKKAPWHWFHEQEGCLFWRKSSGGKFRIDSVQHRDCSYESIEDVTALPEFFIPIQTEPGMGKTNLLNYWSVFHKRKHPDDLVINVRLIKTVDLLKASSFDSLSDVVEFTSRVIDKTASNFVKYIIQSFLEAENKVIVFLDGLDEVPSKHFLKVVKLIHCFKKFTKVRKVVASSRLHAGFTEQMPVYRIAPLSIDELAQYFVQFSRHRNPNKTEEEISHCLTNFFNTQGKWDQLISNNYELLSVPLQANMFATIFFQDLEKLNDSFVNRFTILSLFQRFIDYKIIFHMVHKFQLPSIPNIIYKTELTTRLLEQCSKLAVSVLTKDIDDVSIQLSNSDIRHAKDLLEFGFVSEVNGSDILFIHQTFLEYFAAFYLYQHSNTQKEFITLHLHQNKFSTVHLFFDLLLSQNCPLHTAIISNNDPFICDIKSVDDYPKTDEGDRNVFHLVCLYGTTETMDMLMKLNHDRSSLMLQQDNVLGSKPSQYCFFRDKDDIRWDILSKCLEYDSDIVELDKIQDECLTSALETCVLNDLENLFVFLTNKYKHKVNKLNFKSVIMELDYGTDFVSLLEYTAYVGRTNLVKNILAPEYNFDKDVALESSYTSEKFDCVDFLIESGANIHHLRPENTIIHSLAGKNKLKAIKHLVDKFKIDLDFRDSEQKTPLMEAVKGQNPSFDVIEYLIELKVDVNGVDNEGNNALHICCEYLTHECTKCIQMLLDAGTDVKAINKLGNSVLHSACLNIYTEVETIELLLKQNLDSQKRNSDLMTPLHLAAVKCTADVVKCLIENGCDANTHASGCTALHFACFYEVPLAIDTSKKETKLLTKRSSDFEGAVTHLDLPDSYTKESAFEWIENSLKCYSRYSRDPTETIKLLIEKNLDINCQTQDGYSPLLLASRFNTYKTVKFLIDNGAVVNCLNSYQQNALHTACMNENPDTQIISLLVTCGLDINAKDVNTLSPLLVASNASTAEIVECLFQHGADPTSVNEHDQNALHLACLNQNTTSEMIHVLLKYGVDQKSLDKDRNTPFLIAAGCSSPAVVQTLIDSGSVVHEVDRRQNNAIHKVCFEKECDVEVIQILLDSGVDIDGRNVDCETPLHIAALYSTPDVVQYLLKNGADVSSTDSKGSTALHRVCGDEDSDVNTVEILLKYGLDINSQTGGQFTALHFAARFSSLEVVECLLQHNVDINLVNDAKGTALHEICYNKNGDIRKVQLLLLSGIDIECQNVDLNTPLHIASRFCSPEVVELLLLHNADVNRVNTCQSTPLHEVCYNRNADVRTIEILLTYGADIDSCDEDGQTPLHIALWFGSHDAVEVLINNGADVNYVNLLQHTILHTACLNEELDTRTILLLLKFDIPINSTDKDGNSPLLIAALYSPISTIQILIENHANVNLVNNFGENILLKACKNRKTDVEKICVILCSGIDINSVDGDGNTPLLVASRRASLQVVEFLIQNDANRFHINRFSRNALHEACSSQETDVETIQSLLSSGLTVNDEDINGNTPLIIASSCSSFEVVKFLIERGSDCYHVNRDLRSALHSACSNKDVQVEIISHLIDSGFKIDSVDEAGDTPLIIAARDGSPEIVKILLYNGADCSMVNKYGTSVLHCACFNRDIPIETIQCLLCLGSDINSSDKDNITPLMVAASYNSPEKVEFLIENGANVNDVNFFGFNALHLACRKKETTIPTIECLLKSGFEINSESVDGYTPLLVAARYGSGEVVDFLIKNNADCSRVDKYKNTALHQACYSIDTKVETVLCLLSSGVNINSVDGEDSTPLMTASRYSSPGVVYILIQHGASVNHINEYGLNALHKACQNRETNLLTLQKLLDAGININDVDMSGYTPLMTATLNSSLEVVQFLIDRGADCKRVNNQKHNALHLACFSKETDVNTIQVLLNSGIDINSLDPNENTPLLIAACCSSSEVVEFLINNHADIKAVNTSKFNALHQACWDKGVDVKKIEVLLNSGIDINSVDSNENTPLLIAACRSSSEVVEFLINNHADIKAVNTSKFNALHQACCDKGVDIKKVEILLNSGIDINSLDSNENTPLLIAAGYSSSEVVEFLINNHADIKAVNTSRFNALHQACWDKGVDIKKIEILLNSGIDINSRDAAGMTPLHCAVQVCPLEVIQYLLANFADFTLRYHDFNYNILHAACHNSDVSVVKTFLDFGFDINLPNKQDSTALTIAAECSTREVVQYLLDNGANVNCVDDDGDTVLHNACHNKNIDFAMIKLLVDHGADKKALNKNSKSPAMVALEDHGIDATDVFSFLQDVNM